MKRILSFLLVLTMVLSCVPMSVLADGDSCDHNYVDGFCSACGEAAPDGGEPEPDGEGDPEPDGEGEPEPYGEGDTPPNQLETNAPVINSVTLDKTRITAGESVTVTMDVTDESELAEVRVTFETPFSGVTNMIHVPLTKSPDGLYRGTLTTDSTFAAGTYYAYTIVAEDVLSNRNQINSDRSVCFELVGDSQDTTAPVINSVTLDKTRITAGQSVTVTMDVTDESELAEVRVTFETPFAGVTKTIHLPLSKSTDGLYRGTLTTDASYPCGTYYAYTIVAEDIHGNRNQINEDRSVSFEMVVGGVETDAPVINSVTCDKSAVTAGETLTITADISDESDLADVQVFFDTPLAGSFNDILVHLELDEDGLYRGTLSTSEELPNGNYYLDTCVAIDIHGNRTQVNKNMGSFELSGGYDDVSAPVINSVTVDKSAVTAGETLTITADITDESDLTDVQVFFDTPLAGSFNDILVHLKLSEDGLYRGTLATSEALPNGNYYLDTCVAIDVHGNRRQVNKDWASFVLSGGHTETVAPVINSVTLDKTKVSVGETITITADITDESDLSDLQVFFDTPLSGSFNDILVHLKLDEDGLYRGTLTLDETLPYGDYYLDTCVAIDVHGNRRQKTIESVGFEFGVSKIETDAPVINSISLDKTQVLIGETVTVTMDVVDESELAEVRVTFDTPFAGVSKMIHVNLTLGEDGLYRGTLTTDNTYPCGTYYAYYIVAEDVLGNREQINRDTSVAFEVVAEYPNADLYTVTWNIDGEFYAETEVKAGESITAPDYTVPEGYTFSGWEIPETMPEEDITLNATLTANAYTVTWTIGGVFYAETDVKAGESITAPAYTVPEGYTFSGWDIPETMPEEDITLNATLTVNQYKVTWIVDGEETEEEYTYGETIIAPEAPSKTGSHCVSYSFDKWEGFREGMAMPAEDLTFTAVFIASEHHIDWNRNHVCDRGCGKTDIGEHADSATDRDHRCDYGCRAVLEACSDRNGDRNHSCDICGKKNVSAHTFAEATCTRPATCTECGVKHGKLADHSWDDGKVIFQPTCTRRGVKGFLCTHCNKARFEVLNPVGHDWDEGKVTCRPTCTRNGEMTYTCESCHETRTRQITATGHDYYHGVCRNCGKFFHYHGFHNWWNSWWK